MISRRRKPAPRVHLPLRSLALCLDCDECFEVGPETCPACGSATWTTISRFLEQASSSRRPRRPVDSPSSAKRDDGAPEAVQQLIEALQPNGDVFVCKEAVTLLKDVGTRDSIPIVQKLLKTKLGQHAFVQPVAVETLAFLTRLPEKKKDDKDKPK